MTFCFCFDIKKGGKILGYSTLFFRTMMLLCLMLTLVESIFFENMFFRISNYQESSTIYGITSMEEGRIWITFALAVLFVFGIMSSISFIYGVENRVKIYLLPYIILDVIIVLGVSIFWIVSMFAMKNQGIFCMATIACGKSLLIIENHILNIYFFFLFQTTSIFFSSFSVVLVHFSHHDLSWNRDTESD